MNKIFLVTKKIISLFLFFIVFSPNYVQAAKPDLAFTNYQSGKLSSTININGTSFNHLSPDISIGNGPNSMDKGDFNGDNIVDLVIGNGDTGGDQTITFAFGQGDGTFVNQGSFSLGYEPSGIAAGDFNNDGHLDIFVSNWSGSGGQSVQVLLWDGSGNTTHINALPQVTVASGSNGGTVADFNEDGFLDAAVTNWNAGSVTVLFGDGTGALSPDTVLGAGTRPQNVQVGDLNNDGSLDIAFAHGLSSFVTYYLGTGTKNFGPRVNVPATGDPGTGNVIIGDFNNDGFDDLLTPTIVGNTVSLNVMFWDDLTGQIDPTQHNSLTDGYSESIKAADFNMDGNLDVAASHRLQDKVSIYYGDGNGNLANKVDVPNIVAGSGPLALAVDSFILPTPAETLQEIRDEISDIINTPPPLSNQAINKLTLASDKFNTAILLLGEDSPDYSEITNQIKSAVFHIAQAVEKGLNPSIGETLMDTAAGVVRRLAEGVIATAITNGAPAEAIAEAQAFLVEGDTFRSSLNFVEAIKSYRKAIQRVS